MMAYKKTSGVTTIAITELIEIIFCLPFSFFGCPARAIAIHRTNLSRNPLSTVNINFFHDGTTVITAARSNGTIVRAKTQDAKEIRSS